MWPIADDDKISRWPGCPRSNALRTRDLQREERIEEGEGCRNVRGPQSPNLASGPLGSAYQALIDALPDTGGRCKRTEAGRPHANRIPSLWAPAPVQGPKGPRGGGDCRPAGGRAPDGPSCSMWRAKPLYPKGLCQGILEPAARTCLYRAEVMVFGALNPPEQCPVWISVYTHGIFYTVLAKPLFIAKWYFDIEMQYMYTWTQFIFYSHVKDLYKSTMLGPIATNNTILPSKSYPPAHIRPGKGLYSPLAGRCTYVDWTSRIRSTWPGLCVGQIDLKYGSVHHGATWQGMGPIAGTVPSTWAWKALALA